MSNSVFLPKDLDPVKNPTYHQTMTFQQLLPPLSSIWTAIVSIRLNPQSSSNLIAIKNLNFSFFTTAEAPMSLALFRNDPADSIVSPPDSAAWIGFPPNGDTQWDFQRNSNQLELIFRQENLLVNLYPFKEINFTVFEDEPFEFTKNSQGEGLELIFGGFNDQGGVPKILMSVNFEEINLDE